MPQAARRQGLGFKDLRFIQRSGFGIRVAVKGFGVQTSGIRVEGAGTLAVKITAPKPVSALQAWSGYQNANSEKHCSHYSQTNSLHSGPLGCFVFLELAYGIAAARLLNSETRH